MKAKLVPLPREQTERGWINCWTCIIDLTSCSTYRHFSSMCKWYLLFVNNNFATKQSPWQYFCQGDYYKKTVCIGKTLGNCQLPKWTSRATSDLSNPYVHSTFTKILRKQIFEQNKTMRAASKTQTKFWPKITPACTTKGSN